MTRIKKTKRYSPEWIKQVKSLSKVLTDDKAKEVETKLNELGKLNGEKKTIEDDLNSKKGELQHFKNIISHKKGAKIERNLFETGNVKEHYERKGEKFLGDGSGANEWRTQGWNNLITDHYSPTYQVDTQTANYKDNLYSVNGETYQIPEEETVKILAKVAYELAEIDSSKVQYDNNGQYAGITRAVFENYITHFREQGQAIRARNEQGGFPIDADQGKPGIDKSKFVYDLPQNFTKYDGTAYTNNPFNFADSFTLLEKLSVDDNLINALNKSDANENIWKLTEKGDIYTEQELKDYGITVKDKSKTTLYKSISKVGNEWQTKTHDISVNGGLKGWLTLYNKIFGEKSNRDKLTASYTNSPNSLLFNDLRNQTTFKTHWELPETASGIDELIIDLKSEEHSAVSEIPGLKKQIKDKEKELSDKQVVVNNKGKEIDDKTNELVTDLRKQLTEKYKCDKGFDKISDSEDYRKTRSELFWITRIIKNIRFINTGDEDDATGSTAEENNYLTTAENEIRRRFPVSTYPDYEKIMLVEVFWSDFRFEKGSDEKAIEAWKNDPINNEFTLTELEKAFEEVDKIVRLSESQKTSLEAIKKELEGGDETENWQSKIQPIYSELDSNVITENLVNKWKTVNQFKTPEQFSSLLKQVIKEENNIKTVDQKFLEEIKTADATLVDLKTLLTKEPKQIITLIKRYEYNQLTDTGKSEKLKKLKWTLKRQDSENITEEEINDTLYKIAVAELMEATQAPQKEQLTTRSWGEFLKDWYFTPIWVPILIVGGAVWYFKDQIFGTKTGLSEEDIEEDDSNDNE